MEGKWLLGLRSRKEYEARVQLVNMWVVLCVTSCTVSTLPAPPGCSGSLLGCGGKGKLLPGHAPSPKWLFQAVTVIMTCGA